ncbi:hypothetical protein [Acinetobacter phage Ab69]|nr:hypothetical protein [Acinetobacter phage Ab69]
MVPSGAFICPLYQFFLFCIFELFIYKTTIKSHNRATKGD